MESFLSYYIAIINTDMFFPFSPFRNFQHSEHGPEQAIIIDMCVFM
jgi:hypothetical protein